MLPSVHHYIPRSQRLALIQMTPSRPRPIAPVQKRRKLISPKGTFKSFQSLLNRNEVLVIDCETEEDPRGPQPCFTHETFELLTIDGCFVYGIYAVPWEGDCPDLSAFNNDIDLEVDQATSISRPVERIVFEAIMSGKSVEELMR